MSGGATVEGDDLLRLFLALELPFDVVEALLSWGKRHLSRGRPATSFHVTLAFLGNQPHSALEPILDTLREESTRTRPLQLEPIRYLETRSVGMLVLDDPSGEATRLANRLQRRLEAVGVYRPESRPWLPHVTVVRFRERPQLDPPLPEIGSFAPSGASALLSRLHASARRATGSRYEVLESCSFGERRPGG